MEKLYNKSKRPISLQQKSKIDFDGESLEYSNIVQDLLIKDQYSYNGILSLYGHHYDKVHNRREEYIRKLNGDYSDRKTVYFED